MGIIILVIIVLLFLFFKDSFYTTNDIPQEDKEEPDKTPNYYLPYKVRSVLMSEHERLLFYNLRIVLGSKYDIYPQVNLDKLFIVERQRAYKYYLGWLRRINQKSVDFLAVTRETQSPVFAIELDDSTHEREDRIERDKFVQEIFKRNDFPLIRFNPGQYSIDELKVVFSKYL